MYLMHNWFYVDRLALIVATLVGLVAAVVVSFSHRYLQGNRRKSAFFLNLVGLVLSVLLLVTSNHLLAFAFFWLLSNGFLLRLMAHQQRWRAAQESAFLATKNFVLGGAFLIVAFAFLWKTSGDLFIQSTLSSLKQVPLFAFAKLFLCLAAMTQSAIFPFHRWLTSSLNSPTPVSAIMHAGLVNGGGFLLARFFPVLVHQSSLLQVLFVLGLITAVLGTAWKLIQSDVKRMLACSTMGQMGFMIVQCGLGLFPAAVAHLCWHGLFKAYLFLSSGSAAQEGREGALCSPRLLDFAIALLLGVLGMLSFSKISYGQLYWEDTRVFLQIMAWVACAQFILPIVMERQKKNVWLLITLPVLIGGFYGASVHLMESLLGSSIGILIPQPMTWVYGMGLAALILTWLLSVFKDSLRKIRLSPYWIKKVYVRLLNASQPHPKTITAYRNDYRF